MKDGQKRVRAERVGGGGNVGEDGAEGGAEESPPIINSDLVQAIVSMWELTYPSFVNLAVRTNVAATNHETSTSWLPDDDERDTADGRIGSNIGDSSSPPGALSSLEERGRGLYIRTRFVSRNETVYVDAKPLVVMQHVYSQRCCTACSNCCRVVGGLRMQINRVLGNSQNQSLEKDFPEQSSYLSDSLLERTGLQTSADSSVNCCSKCGAFFCGASCLRTAVKEGHHRVLCVDATTESRKLWREFCRHAKRYSEHLLLAGLAYASIIAAVKYRNASLEEQMAQFTAFYTLRNWHSLPSSVVCETRHSSDLVDSRDRLRILQESLRLLEMALMPLWRREGSFGFPQESQRTTHFKRQTRQPLPNWRRLFDYRYYDKLMGQFELVNVNVEFENPLNGLLQKHSALLQPCAQLFQLVRSIADCDDCLTAYRQSGQVVDFGAVFPPFMGIGLYRTVALTNHSCSPNVEIDYPGNDCVAHVQAIRDIGVGEQLTQSYIDEELPLSERRELLRRRYGFTCQCSKCRMEEAEQMKCSG